MFESTWRANFTAQELLSLIQNSSAASALVSVSLEVGSDPLAVIGNRGLAYSPLTLHGLGSSFDTATDLGKIGSSQTLQTSLVLASSIDPESYALDLPGASDDPGHRVLSQNVIGSFEDHVNSAFGADAKDGITTIYYNFRTIFSQDNLNAPLTNAISAEQKARAKEALGLWSKYIGVQFVETANLGLTIATGSLTGVRTTSGELEFSSKTVLDLVFTSTQLLPIR